MTTAASTKHTPKNNPALEALIALMRKEANEKRGYYGAAVHDAANHLADAMGRPDLRE